MSRKHKMRDRRLADQKPAVQNAERVGNGLNEALFPSGMGWQPQAFGQQAVSQPNELFADLRGFLVSNNRQLLSQAYVEIGLIQALVDVPVDDGFRGGVDILTKQLSPEQLKDLQKKMMVEGDLTVQAQSMKWDRLFGGAGTIIMVDQPPEQEFNPLLLKPGMPMEFRASDLWELFYDLINVEGFNVQTQTVKFDYYSYYGTKLHKSRVFKLKGIEAPSYIRPRLRGWGVSIVEVLIRSLNQNLKGTNLIYELLDEAKLDVYHLKNLADTLMQAQGTQLVQARVAMANRQKNYQNAIVLDAEDKYEQKAFTFAGLADVMKEVRVQVASDMRMPMTKLFGLQSSGFSDDEGSIENYNMMVESTVREKAKPGIVRMIELRCQQMFGFVPTDIELNFKPLRQVKATEEDQVKTGQFNRLLGALTGMAITVDEFREACTKHNLLGVPLEKASVGELGDPNEDSSEDPKEDDGNLGANASATEAIRPPDRN